MGTKPLCWLQASLGELPGEKTRLLGVPPLPQAPLLGTMRPAWPLRSRNRYWVIGRTRSEVTFQWSSDGGTSIIAIFGLWKRSRGISSVVYSNSGMELSPNSRGKPTRGISSPPGCQLQRVWSLKPLSWAEASGSSLTSNIALLATSNRTGCCSAIGTTQLASEGFTNRSLEEVILSSDVDWEPALCHSFRRM